TPEPGLDILNPLKHRTASGDPSTYGKILATIGGVGNVLSSLVGQPVGPPPLRRGARGGAGAGERLEAARQGASTTARHEHGGEGARGLRRRGGSVSPSPGGRGGV